MASFISLEAIKSIIEHLNPVEAMEKAFRLYSTEPGRVVVPPVGELIFDDPPGDVHIKYGFVRGNDFYIIKIASGFYGNPKFGLPSSDGLMLLFNQRTGVLESVLLDRGYLTNVRTAAAGAVAAKYLAPAVVKTVGILGAGTQARMQLEFLARVRSFDRALVWGLNREELEKYRHDMSRPGLEIELTLDAEEICRRADLIVTCTPSTRPLLKKSWIRAGIHITAVGSDTPEKQELEAGILEKASRVVVDSRFQARTRGECHHALQAGLIREDRLIELGEVVAEPSRGRVADDDITVADLTGVAIQDIFIAEAVYGAWKAGHLTAAGA